MLFYFGSNEAKERKLKRGLEKMIQQFIPCGDIPKIHQNMPRLNYWYGMDNEQRYTSNPHPDWGPRDIEYHHNSYGYRCPEFEGDYDFKIVSIGSSYTYGVGLPTKDIFHEKVAELIRGSGRTVVNWNLGQGGASNDYIARTLHLAVPKLKPDLVLINFTFPSRREYFTADGTFINYCPTWNHMLPKTEEREHLFALTSDYDNIMRLFANYKSIQSLLDGHGVRWLWSTLSEDILTLGNHLDKSNYVGYFSLDDYARDRQHPGIQSHHNIFLKYKEKLNDLS